MEFNKCVNKLNSVIQLNDIQWEFLASPRSQPGSRGDLEYPKTPRNEIWLQCSSESLFFQISWAGKRLCVALSVLIIEQPVTSHLAKAKAKAGHCHLSLCTLPMVPWILIHKSECVHAHVQAVLRRTCESMCGFWTSGCRFILFVWSVLLLTGTPPASCCHLKTQTRRKRERKINKTTLQAAWMEEDVILAMNQLSLLRHRKTNE